MKGGKYSLIIIIIIFFVFLLGGGATILNIHSPPAPFEQFPLKLICI